MIKNITITCHKCNSKVVDISFLYEDKDANVIPTMKIAGFLFDTSMTHFRRTALTNEILDEICKIINSNYEKCHQADPDTFGFICARCGVPYCINCWANIMQRFDEDGFYDDTRGTCPRGHDQMLAD